MTDPFTPTALHLVEGAPIATATTEATREFLHGPALRAAIAERIEQIEVHGHDAADDIFNDKAELALAAREYLQAYIDICYPPLLRFRPSDAPEGWPWAALAWKEPTLDEPGKLKALIKTIALLLAEADRIIAAQAFLTAARPLAETVESPLDGLGLKRASDLLPKDDR